MAPPHSINVMFDTNSVFTESMQHVFCRDAEALVRRYSSHFGISVEWMIPEMVRSEREWQMRAAAVAQLGATRKMQKLFDQNWVEDEAAVAAAVSRSVDKQLNDLGVAVITCDVDRVKWQALISAAAFRSAPFSPDKSEKGFRDAIICETLCQRLEGRSLGDETYIIVSRDDLLREALETRLRNIPRLKICKVLEEVRNEINFLAAPIDAETAQALSSKAQELFASAGLWNAFYTGLQQRFGTVLNTPPPGISDVQMLNHWLSLPVFIERIGSRVKFACRYTYARSGLRWVPELPRSPPMSPSDLTGGNVINTPFTFVPTANPVSDGWAGPSEIWTLGEPDARQPFPFLPLNPFNAVGHWERIELPTQLSFSFIWSAEYASDGHISDSRVETILQEPF